MQVRVQFFSYLRDLTGCAQTDETLVEGSKLSVLHEHLMAKYPRLRAMQNSTLIAVDVNYQSRDYVLQAGDEVSFFPPVQGG